MQCRKCNQDNPSDALFCMMCGIKFVRKRTSWVKKIIERCKAVWKDKAISDCPPDCPQKNPQSKSEESETRLLYSNTLRQVASTESVNTATVNSQVTEFSLPDKKDVWGKLIEGQKKSSELDWKIIFFVIAAIVGAFMVGVLIGYMISTMELLRKLGL